MLITVCKVNGDQTLELQEPGGPHLGENSRECGAGPSGLDKATREVAMGTRGATPSDLFAEATDFYVEYGNLPAKCLREPLYNW